MRRSKQTAITARSVSVLLLVVVSALVASGLRAAVAQAPSDPCAQVTAAEVSAALGETVAAGQKAGTKTCSWSANKPTHQIVSLMYSPPGDWTTRKTRQLPGVTYASVSGVGDEAFAETAANYTTLYVKKGSTTFMVRVYGVPDLGRQLAIESPSRRRSRRRSDDARIALLRNAGAVGWPTGSSTSVRVGSVRISQLSSTS